MARTSTARRTEVAAGQIVTATFTDPGVVPHRTTLGRYERGREGTGPYPAVLVGLLALASENGGSPDLEPGGDLPSWLAEARERVGLTLADLEEVLVERVRGRTLRLRGTVACVEADRDRLYLKPDDLPVGPVPVNLAAVELEIDEPETPPAPEPFSSRKAERVTHRRIMAASGFGPTGRYAWVEDGWMISTSPTVTARTRTEREEGAYTIDGRDVDPVEDGPGLPTDELVPIGSGELGRLRVEAPLSDLFRAHRAASSDSARRRPALANVLFEVVEDGRTVRIVGCDGHRLTWNTRRSLERIPPGHHLVDEQAMAVFLREKKAPVVEIRFDEGLITLNNGNTVVSCRRSEIPYPDWQDVVPEAVERVVCFDRQDAWEALRALEKVARTNHNNRVVFGEGDGLTFELEAGEGDGRERAELAYRPARAGQVRRDTGTLQMPLRMLDREADFAFNLVYLKDVLRGISGPHVFLGYNTPDKAFVFRGRSPVLLG